MPKRWEVVRDDLASEIAQGRLRPGDRLPPDPMLAARYGVNRLTVRHAIQVMAVDGLLRVQQGVGTFVANTVLDYTLGTQVRLTQSLLAQERLIRRVMLFKEVVACSPVISRSLKIRRRANAAFVRFAGLADEVPHLLSANWFPLSRLPGIMDSFSGLNSISDALARCGVRDYQRQWSRVSARLATEEETNRLQLPPRSPVLVQKVLDVDAGGVPVKYGESVWRADRTEFVIDR